MTNGSFIFLFVFGIFSKCFVFKLVIIHFHLLHTKFELETETSTILPVLLQIDANV